MAVAAADDYEDDDDDYDDGGAHTLTITYTNCMQGEARPTTAQRSLCLECPLFQLALTPPAHQFQFSRRCLVCEYHEQCCTSALGDF